MRRTPNSAKSCLRNTFWIWSTMRLSRNLEKWSNRDILWVSAGHKSKLSENQWITCKPIQCANKCLCSRIPFIKRPKDIRKISLWRQLWKSNLVTARIWHVSSWSRRFRIESNMSSKMRNRCKTRSIIKDMPSRPSQNRRSMLPNRRTLLYQNLWIRPNRRNLLIYSLRKRSRKT